MNQDIPVWMSLPPTSMWPPKDFSERRLDSNTDVYASVRAGKRSAVLARSKKSTFVKDQCTPYDNWGRDQMTRLKSEIEHFVWVDVVNVSRGATKASRFESCNGSTLCARRDDKQKLVVEVSLFHATEECTKEIADVVFRGLRQSTREERATVTVCSEPDFFEYRFL